MVVFYCLFCVFFFKQKTAYEMRISDWSSDVCSSDLLVEREQQQLAVLAHHGHRIALDAAADAGLGRRRDVEYLLAAAGRRQHLGLGTDEAAAEIGRASCRERVCQYV